MGLTTRSGSLDRSVQVGELEVAGIVSRAPRPTLEPVVDSAGESLMGSEGEPIAYFPENQGLVVAMGIKHAIDLIDANPIGFLLD